MMVLLKLPEFDFSYKKRAEIYKRVTSLCHHIELLYSYFVTMHLNAREKICFEHGGE